MIRKFRDYPLRGGLTRFTTSHIWLSRRGIGFSREEWENIYRLYIQGGGNPLDGFNEENLEKVLDYLENLQK
ncbi:hypothetical protein EBU71_04620 [bacterium]|nr:hypothetical protein [Candidatus Elulimicrobium humile]